nr:MAG TPA: hypothetical protein [Caudoviricetes sp.]
MGKIQLHESRCRPAVGISLRRRTDHYPRRERHRLC